MDIVWLKKDVRLHDHGPLSAVGRSKKPFLLLYVYEPDQLSHHSVHGSHIRFTNEGLINLDKNIRKRYFQAQDSKTNIVTYRHGEITEVLSDIHQVKPVARLLSHMETGHLCSYARDIRVRAWCKKNGVIFLEFNQTGVTRCLKNRDEFTKHFNNFMQKPQHPVPPQEAFGTRLVRTLFSCGIQEPCDLQEVSHPSDRIERQKGGESLALQCLENFLGNRGEHYSFGISSPAKSWHSCSRLSPYLTYGNISIRKVLQTLRLRQQQLRLKNKTSKTGKSKPKKKSSWLKSLAAFNSRMRWRSHFMQKLESEPMCEKHALCPAYDKLRASEEEWNQEHYDAWESGNTGFPMVDACMRCLIKHGWINFRMRAMLVSFACYNLWLDWRKIAPHLARCFLDYEPGIHYPQLQMQAGVTGINAMRVYSVTKQGQDQDPNGTFIRNYCPELQNVPTKYIHEPYKMPISVQKKCDVRIGNGPSCHYPKPIVDEKLSARRGKDRVAAVRRLESTKKLAKKVYEKHGSRKRRNDFSSSRKKKNAKSKMGNTIGVSKKIKAPNQATITYMLKQRNSISTKESKKIVNKCKFQVEPKNCCKLGTTDVAVVSKTTDTLPNQATIQEMLVQSGKVSNCKVINLVTETKKISTIEKYTTWICSVCTFLNSKMHAPVCEICRRPRKVTAIR